MNTSHITVRYKVARERLKQARLRGGEDEVDRLQDEMDACWKLMSGADRRSILGVGAPQEEKRAA